ncbi:MAG: Gfo/Idh/MocA family oxidoreductase [Candidatus Sumerlaeota bacterium]|nr:Gfo/Idh/MocA family oxidoreductase [Candidatus Sumerlaeota bacterium]
MAVNDGIKRRELLKAGIGTGVGLLILPFGLRAGAQSPNNKLNVAVIGVSGRGGANLGGVSGENIVALCDVDEQKLSAAAKKFPNAKTYADWRKCLDQKDIDAVVCSTTDHTHAFVNVWAMNRGKHVYCEKPLANSVHEARTVRETYLKNKSKIATQMGTQIHATDNFRRVVEMIRDGAIGKPQEVRVWCTRTPDGGNYFPEALPVPPNLNWDLWIGPSPMHPYNPKYLAGGCLGWNRFWDFGSGQIGDMGSHMLDLAYWAYDLRFPTSCEAAGTPVNPDTCPQSLTATWDHPATDKRPAVKVYWYDGGKKPDFPGPYFDREKLFKGMLFKGDGGWLLADYDLRILGPKGDMTQYKTPKTEDLIPKSLGHHQEWIAACKTGTPTLCNFDYSGALIEHNLLALVAYRTGKKLQWDAASLKATNCPEADQYIQKKYREGWTLNG